MSSNDFDIKKGVLKGYYGSTNVRHLVIPNGVTTIKSLCSDDYSDFNRLRENVESVQLPNSVISIESRAFLFFKKLRAINIPYGVKTIEASAFSMCYELSSINLPDSIVEIKKYAFSDCNLYNVKIPSGLTTIQPFTFYCCPLQTVTIPVSVTEIKTAAFSSSSLKDVFYGGTIAQWNSIKKKKGFGAKCENYTIHCTDGDIKVV